MRLGETDVLFSAATDGRVALWIAGSEAPFHVLPLHQSGVNSIDAIPLSHNTIRLCTCGDDNAITLTDIELNHVGVVQSVAILSTSSFTNAHTASATGIAILSSDTICTISIDQRINIWRCEVVIYRLKLQIHTIKHRRATHLD